MKTKTVAPAATLAIEQLKMESADIDVGSINVIENHRKHFNEMRMRELADSIRAVGILQPLIVRRNGAEFDLIAGERRLRAAKTVGLEMVPVRIVDVDEQKAAEIQALENLHREDLNPIDEARNFKTLIEKYGHKPEELADRVNKSVSYINRMTRLLDLPENVVAAIEEEKITAAHGTVIARLQDPAEQESMLLAILAQKLSAKAAENALAGHARDLSKASFDVTGCQACKHNGKKQKDLFDRDTDLGGRCMNPPCFDEKAKSDKTAPKRKPAKTKGKAVASTSQFGFHAAIESIVENVRKDSNLGYMRVMAIGLVRNADDRVKFEFMRRRESSIKKSEADREIRKYLEKLTDFFVPGFCVELTILSENTVKEGELVHQFKKLYGVSKPAAPAAANKTVQDSLKEIGAQMGKDEKAAKTPAPKK